jgi:transcriptional regulator with XRE-family HTH domain
MSNPAVARLRELPALVAAERARRSMSQRQVAASLDLSPSTISRVEKGQLPDVSAFLNIVGWLRLPLGWFTGEIDPQDAYRRGWDDCAAGVRAALHATPRPDAVNAAADTPEARSAAHHAAYYCPDCNCPRTSLAHATRCRIGVARPVRLMDQDANARPGTTTTTTTGA